MRNPFLWAFASALILVPTSALAQAEPAQRGAQRLRLTPGNTNVVPPNWSDPSKLNEFKSITPPEQGVLKIEKLEPLRSGAGNLNITAPNNPGLSVPGLGLPETKLLTETHSVERRVNAEGERDKSVLKDLQTDFSRIEVPGISVAKGSGEYVSRGVRKSTEAGRFAAGALDINTKIAASVQNAQANGVALSLDSLQELPSVQAIEGTKGANSGAAKFADAYKNVFRSLSSLLKNPTDSNNLSQWRNDAVSVQRSFVDNFSELKKDPAALRTAVKATAALQQNIALKGIFGVPTNFDPPSYRDIYRISRRSVGLAMSNEPMCSGVLLTARWILTAGHCFRTMNWEDVRIVFKREGGEQAIRAKTIDLWPKPAPGVASVDGIDYVFVHLDRSNELDKYVAELGLAYDHDGTADAIGDLCVRDSPVAYREPVFVIAHTGDMKKVHDFAYVWFPHKATKDVLTEVSAMNYLNLTQYAATRFDSKDYRDNYVKTKSDLFDSMYTLVQPGGGKSDYYEFRSSGRDFATKRPFFGLDSDTFHGNSGAPVFSRKDLCLIGVFSAGIADDEIVNQISVADKELATPFSQVIEDLAKQATDAGSATSEQSAARQSLVKAIEAALK